MSDADRGTLPGGRDPEPHRSDPDLIDSLGFTRPDGSAGPGPQQPNVPAPSVAPPSVAPPPVGPPQTPPPAPGHGETRQTGQVGPGQYGTGHPGNGQYGTSQYGTSQYGTGQYGHQPGYPLQPAPGTGQWQHLGSPLRGPDYVMQPGPGGPDGTQALPAATLPQPRSPRLLLLLALIIALLGGLAGGFVGIAYDRSQGQSTAAGTLPGGPLLGTGAPSPTDASPTSVASIAAKLLPSVVTIGVSGSGESGTGSGVIIRKDGFILTNNHVVSVAAAGGSVRVDLYKGQRNVAAQIIGRDPKTDLAVIRIPRNDLPAATLGQSRSLVVGAPVVALGAPLGLSSTVTSGIVSALDRNVDVPTDNGDSGVLIGAIQTDAAINPGNSGGPLVDSAGQVIGINSAIATAPGSTGSGGGNIGVGFAIPIDYARSVAEEIIRTGKATHPYLGVTASSVDPGAASTPGAMVQTIVPGGPAARASLQVGDLITKVNDMPIAGVDDLIAATRLHQVGDVVSVTYERGGQSKTVQVTLQESKG